MDILLLVVLVILAGFGLHGYLRGLVRVVFSLVAIFLSIGIATTLTPHITEFLRTQTPLYDTVREKCTDYIQDRLQTSLQTEEKTLEPGQDFYILGLKVPKEFQNTLRKELAKTTDGLLEHTSVHKKLGKFVADQLLQRAAWAISFALSSIILFTLVHFLDLIAKLPVLKSLNRMGGLAIGLLQGLIVVWILFLLVVLFQGSEWGRQMIDSIHKNAFLELLYEHNAMEQLIMGGYVSRM